MGASTLEPHESNRLTQRSLAIDTSHLPDDCGPMSAFGKQHESTKKNNPAFLFSRTTRAERSRSCNFDERTTKEAMQVLQAERKLVDVTPPPGAYESDALWDVIGDLGDSPTTRYRKKNAHDFGRSIGRDASAGSNIETVSISEAVTNESRFGADVPRFQTARISSFGPQVARKSAPFLVIDFDAQLSRGGRDRGDARRRHGGALEKCALGVDAPPVTKTAVILSSLGEQKLSTRESSNGFSWGKSPRKPFASGSKDAEEIEALRGPGMYHRAVDFRDTLREIRETRILNRTIPFLTSSHAGVHDEKASFLSSSGASKFTRTSESAFPRLAPSPGGGRGGAVFAGDEFGTAGRRGSALGGRSSSSRLKYWARSAPAGTSPRVGRPGDGRSGSGTLGRREPRFFPQTAAEVRDSFAGERDATGRHPDGSKRRLWA